MKNHCAGSVLGSYLRALRVAEYALADTQALGCYLKKLVICKKFKAVLKAEYAVRHETERFRSHGCL